MTDNNGNDWIEQILQKDEPYISNEGFSKQVTELLSKRRRLSWRVKRRMIKAVSILSGTIVSVVAVSILDLPPQLIKTWESSLGYSLIVLSAMLATAGACVWIYRDRV